MAMPTRLGSVGDPTANHVRSCFFFLFNPAVRQTDEPIDLTLLGPSNLGQVQTSITTLHRAESRALPFVKWSANIKG